MTTDDLIAFWARLGEGGLHPDDAGGRMPAGIETAALCPIPWMGPLRHARVYVLLLHPVLTPEDRPYAAARQDFAEEMRDNLRGTRPWLYLLDRFQDHPGRRWATHRFGPDIGLPAATSICTLHLVAYHAARRGPAARAARKLPSAEAMRRFVRATLLPGAQAGRFGVILARAASLYGIAPDAEGGGLLVYDPRREASRGRETPETRGGALLRRFIR